MSIRAIYKDGVLKPLEELSIKEGTEVKLDVYPVDEKGNGGTTKRPWKSLKDSPAYGIWKDRDDIGTGAEYVARIRKYRDVPEKK